MRKQFCIKNRKQFQNGTVALEVVMITAVAVPVTFFLLVYFIKAFTALYGLLAALTGWPIL
ncbi:MAG: hypothetical protein LBE12_13640 [Planctomycetaceae bacterium]|jgi:hypothetical protein|nr:hypothetical protein [Planctomycetaceae bacterium]